MDSNCSAGLFEHVAKMGRIIDPVPSAASGSTPMVLFRPTVTPFAEAQPYTIPLDPTTEKENAMPAVKLKMEPVTSQVPITSMLPSAPPTDIAQKAKQERVLNKQRQREFERRASQSSAVSSLRDQDKDIDTSEADSSVSRRKSRSERKRAKRQMEALQRNQQVEAHVQPETSAARALQEARSQRWHHPQPGSVSETSTISEDKPRRSMRAAPKQRSRTSSTSSIYSQSSVKRGQELLRQLQMSQQQAEQQRQLQLSAQELINQAATTQQHESDTQRASQLLNDAFPLAAASDSANHVPSAPLSPTSQRSSLGKRSNKTDPNSRTSSLDKLFSQGSLAANRPGHRSRGPSEAWNSPSLNQPLTTTERQQLLSAIREELHSMTPSSGSKAK